MGIINGFICFNDAADNFALLFLPEVFYTRIYNERNKRIKAKLFFDGEKMNNKNIRKIILAIFVILFASFVAIEAGETGKLTGKIIDAATGEALPGVNILIEGTSRGAATNIDGEYLILNILPGTYSLKVSFIGYRNVIVENVQIKVDLTTSVDVELQEATLELGSEVVITADRPVIQKDLTSSTQFIGFEEMSQLPVVETEEALYVQTGVFFDPIPVMGGLGSAGRGEKRYSVRGGSQLEIRWFIDGNRTTALTNGRADWGGAFTKVNFNTIEEMQVMTGGFNPEYGDAQSGVVNVITKKGTENYHASAEFIYGFAGQHHFGNYLYDRSTQKEFLDNTLPDGSLDPNWWTPYRQSQTYDYTRVPDRNLSLTLSGPVPLVSINEMPIKFFLSSQFKQDAYVLPHPREARRNTNLAGNFLFSGKQTSLRISGMFNHNAHSTLQENGDFTNQTKYYRGWGSLIDTYTYNFSANFSHALSNTSFYELKLSYFLIDFKERPSEFTVLGISSVTDIWGFQRYENFGDEPFDKFAPLLKNHSQSGDVSFEGSLNLQVDKSNLVKAGLEFRYNTSSDKGSWRYPSDTDNPKYWINRGLHETYHPIQVAFYIQDKMEFESMILNFGLRYDYFNPNYDWFDRTDLYNLAVDPLYDETKDLDGDQVDSDGRVKYSFENVLSKPRSPAEDYHMLSPRFGVSFPITENSLLHFNYGHFLQMPPLDQLFELGYFRPIYIVDGMRANNVDHFPSADGDPERVVGFTNAPLEPAKTIMFEVGFKQNFGDLAVLDITAFYKDVFEQTQERAGLFDHAILGYDPFREAVTANQSYQTFLSGDYGDSRGFEISLRSLFSNNFNVDINYSFSKSVRGRATPSRITLSPGEDPVYDWAAEIEKRIPIENSFSRPHILRANVYLRYPDSDDSFLSPLLEGTSLSILFNFVSGQAFTYLSPEDPPETYNNQRFPDIHTVDLRVEKSVQFLDSHTLSVFLQIKNLFNTKNLRSYGDALFDADATKKFVESGEITTVDGAGYDISWQTYYDKRRINLGVKYFF